jgi:hypothetical protein
VRFAWIALLLVALVSGCSRNRRKWATLTLKPAPASVTRSVRLELVDLRGQSPSPLMNAEELITNPVLSFTRGLLAQHLMARGIGVSDGGATVLRAELLDAWWLVDVHTLEVHAFARLRATFVDPSGHVEWTGFGAGGTSVPPGTMPFLEWEAGALEDALEKACRSTAAAIPLAP